MMRVAFYLNLVPAWQCAQPPPKRVQVTAVAMYLMTYVDEVTGKIVYTLKVCTAGQCLAHATNHLTPCLARNRRSWALTARPP